jgi:hypothetical protein
VALPTGAMKIVAGRIKRAVRHQKGARIGAVRPRHDVKLGGVDRYR